MLRIGNTKRVRQQTTSDTIRSSTAEADDLHTLCMGTGKKTDEAILAGERIKRACLYAEIDRTELAKRTKLSYSRLGNYEQGLREVPIREARLIEKATGVPAAYIMGLVDEMDMEILRSPRAAREGYFQTLKATGQIATPPSKRGERRLGSSRIATY